MKEFVCPYCGSSENPSKDHIFSDFFGVRQTIEACRDCNGRSGYNYAQKNVNL